MSDVKDRKTHGKVGLAGILGDYPPATEETLAGDDLLTKLHDILEPESLLYINNRIAPNQGDYVGEKLDTENTIGLVLRNKDYEPASLICITPNSNTKPIVTDTSQSCAFIIGSLNNDHELVAVDNLHEGIELAYHFMSDKITMIVSPNDWLFTDTVKHFAQDTKITVFTTLEQKSKLSKQLAGINVKLVIPVLSMLSHVEQHVSYAEVLSYDDTQVIDLQSSDWADPKPINHTLPPVTSITPDMLPETLYSYVMNTANRLSVPLEFVAVPLVVALGSVIGTKVSIFPKRHDDWQVIPNLWGAVIGQPSSKKSPAMDNAMKPIDNLISKAMTAHKSNMKEHATQTLINTAKAKSENDALKSLAKQLASQDDNTDSAEKITEEDIHQKAAAIAESKHQDENIPIPRRHMVSDITVEKLGEIENQNNNGVLQYRDELSGFLSNLEKDSEQQARSFYLEGFNGTGSYTVDRIMRGSLFIENHCLSVMGGIQPDKLEMYLEKTMRGLGNDGLMQRFQMMVYPDPLPRTKEKDIAVDKESRDAVYSLFIAADELNIGTLKGYGANEANQFYKRPHFRFADDAYKVFMSWLDDLNDKADNAEHDVIAQHLIKYGRLIPALALIFHLVDCIENRSLLGGVSLKALQAAIAWGDMLETHMLRVYSCITDNSHLKASLLSKKILDMLKKGGDKTDKTNWVSHGFTARSLNRKNWKGLTDDNAVQTALDVLVEYDWLSYEIVNSTGQGGRPTELYCINPKLKAFI